MSFLPVNWNSAADRLDRVTAASRRRISPEMLAILREQSGSHAPSRARREHLAALSEPGTVVAVTGQQVGLFLGPLYTLYKAASVVAAARAITAESGVRCVPLFWLQTEDHDFAEIATCVAPTQDGPLHLRLEDDPSLARRSIGDRCLPEEVTRLVEILAESVSSLQNAPSVVDLVRASYRPGASWATAFAEVMSTLFADDGLVTLNPRCTGVARLAVPVMQTALLESARIDELLAERGRLLAEAGLTEQIQRRPGSPLPFFHLEDARGPRHRLVRSDGGYAVPEHDGRYSHEDLLRILEREPLRFSTSALLRPILQDTLLPTAVYIGGPAELKYFAQVAPLYPVFGLEAPLIAERAHLCLVPRRTRRLLTQLGLEASDLNEPRDALLRKLAPVSSDAPSPAWLAELGQRLDTIEHDLPDAVRRTRATVHRAIDRLAQRHQRVMVERDQVMAGRLARVSAWLRPNGEPQERVHSFPAFAAQAGIAEFMRTVSAAIDPFQPAVRMIDLP